MIELPTHERFDLEDPEDCMDLVVNYGWTNERIQGFKETGSRYVSVPKHHKNRKE